MARVDTFKAMAIVIFAAVLSMAVSTVSAQDLSEAPAPAPGLDTGSSYSSGISGAMLWSSLVIAALAIFKQWSTFFFMGYSSHYIWFINDEDYSSWYDCSHLVVYLTQINRRDYYYYYVNSFQLWMEEMGLFFLCIGIILSVYERIK